MFLFSRWKCMSVDLHLNCKIDAHIEPIQWNSSRALVTAHTFHKFPFLCFVSRHRRDHSFSIRLHIVPVVKVLGIVCMYLCTSVCINWTDHCECATTYVRMRTKQQLTWQKLSGLRKSSGFWSSSVTRPFDLPHRKSHAHTLRTGEHKSLRMNGWMNEQKRITFFIDGLWCSNCHQQNTRVYNKNQQKKINGMFHVTNLIIFKLNIYTTFGRTIFDVFHFVFTMRNEMTATRTISSFAFRCLLFCFTTQKPFSDFNFILIYLILNNFFIIFYVLEITDLWWTLHFVWHKEKTTK